MTREEIMQKGKKKFPPVFTKEIREDGSIVRTDVNATVRHAYIQGLIDNNCQLPPNLDGAVEEKYPDFSNSIASKATLDGVRNAFKAGAEWMVRQGETIDGEVLTTSDYDWETIRIPKKLYPLGTEVTLQIRKKQ